MKAALLRNVTVPILLMLCGSGAVVSAAEPYRPDDDNEVLLVLPTTFNANRGELATLRQRLSDDPKNVELASQVAAAYVELGGQESDPRYYGYAQAALSPWWDKKIAPVEILKLRAKLKERDHRYDEALEDLQRLVKLAPRDTQAWIEIANINRVQGNYDVAEQAAFTLSQIAGPIPEMIALVPIEAVTGRAEEAYDKITHAMPQVRKDYPNAIQWFLTMQADIARSLGRDEQAEAHSREALDREPNDLYMIRSYADFLIGRDRADEALPLLRDHTADNGSLMLSAIAARDAGEEDLAKQYLDELLNRFAEIRLRGGLPHGRFESRCALELQNDPQRALDLALANWHRQKEMNDTRNVLAAAIAADDPEAAKPVLDFLNEHGNEDVLLNRLAKQLTKQNEASE